MKKFALVLVFFSAVFSANGQCTISCGTTPCSVNWTNSPATCPTGGTIIIPAGVTLIFDTSQDTWTGVEIIVHGTLLQSFNGGNRIDANLVVKSGGVVDIQNQLSLGANTAGCNYTVKVEAGGNITVPGDGPGADDKLWICGKQIIRSGTQSCNVYVPDANPPTPLPYCNPDGGFNGPIDFDQDGVQPVELISFTAKRSGSSIEVKWATSKEEEFSHFVLQHAINNLDFSDLAEIPGAGYNTESVLEYTYTHALPLIGHNYYRLKAVDLDGSFEYFGPVVERYQGTKALWVHPNPSSATKVEFKTNFTPNEGDRVQVFNPLGLLISDVPVDQAKGVVHFNEPVRAGSYILRYVSVQETTFARFVVIN
jgi:hypothetical protein